MTGSRAACFAIAIAALAGCGPKGLSERYGAEEAFWDAERHRAAFSGRGIPTARQEIMERYRKLLARHGFTPWKETADAPCLAGVNQLRGLARLALGHVALAGGEVAVADGEFNALLRESPPGGPLTGEARLGVAKVLEARGDFPAAAREYGAVFEALEPGQALDAASLASVLALPLYVAERWRALGEPAAADSVLAGAERRIDAYRVRAADRDGRAAATDGLARVRVARGDQLGAAALMEEAAGTAEGNRREALLVAGARMALAGEDPVAARRLLDGAGGASGSGALPAARRRTTAALLIREGRALEGRALLLETFESAEGEEEERAGAGIDLGDLDAARGDRSSAAEQYRRVETRYPATAARVDATVRRARLQDAGATGLGDARERAAADLKALAAARPGLERSMKAEDAAAALLEEIGDWRGLVALLDAIVAARPSEERAAGALLRAALAARDHLPGPDPARQRAAAERLEREFAGTLAALQARRLGLLAPLERSEIDKPVENP